jgi:hypothetical protein
MPAATAAVRVRDVKLEKCHCGATRRQAVRRFAGKAGRCIRVFAAAVAEDEVVVNV